MNYNDFQNKLDSIQYNEDRFKMWTEDGRTAMVLSPSRAKDPKGTISMMRSVYKSVLELDWKIKVSLSIAAAHVLKDDENVNSWLPVAYSQKAASYYIENALFRLTSLWDMLAQGYRVLYDVKKNLMGKKIDINHMKYKNFFDHTKTPHTNFEDEANRIFDYISNNCNHRTTNELRNQMAHIFTPNLFYISNYTVNAPYPMSFQITTILEDYIKVTKYLSELFDNAEKIIAMQMNNL